MSLFMRCLPRASFISRNVGPKWNVPSSLPPTPRLLMVKKEMKPAFCVTSKYSNSANHNIPNIDPKQESRRKGLWILTCMSGCIGAVLLTAVGAREYQKLKFRARGMVPIKNRLYGRKPIVFQYRGYNLLEFIANAMDNVHTFEVKEDDTWVVTFPKAGTTWLQEIVFLIQSDCDFEGAKTHIDDRFPYLEFFYPGLKTIANTPSPRLIKSHLPLSLLPNEINHKKPKIIYIARNPKDTVVSFYNFSYKFLKSREAHNFHGTFEDYCQLFCDDLGPYGPWWKHVKEAWDRRNDDNILFLKYEDMQTDLAGCIVKIASFLGKTLSSADVEAIKTHCTFDNMKTNNAVNYNWFKEGGMAEKNADFMRKGKVGDWKNHLSQETVAKLDEIVKTKLEPSGLVFTDTLDDAGTVKSRL